ncbi:MAG: hypothetical protein MUC41_07025 [Syntrophobacteraceae bacterium]|nr:hypothetical protein [Syntrophobacteraceae bacterium]
MTTIASSVTLVSTTPVFTSLFSRFWLGEGFDRWTLTGVACSMLGGFWVAGSDFSISGEAFWGDLLAIGEAPSWSKAGGLAVLGLGIVLCSLSTPRRAPEAGPAATKPSTPVP